MIRHDVKQGTSEWLALRRGIPTASEFDSIISPTWKARTGDGVRTYMVKKVCEKLLGFTSEDVQTFAMGQGVILEQEARPFYSFTYDVAVDAVGFCTTDDGRFGCSPDGFIGKDGGLEIKCPTPEKHLGYLLAGVVPPDYLAQVHGSLYVTGRQWWDFLSYSRQFPALVVRVQRDEAIMAAIGSALENFHASFTQALAKVTAMRDAENAVKAANYQGD